MDTNTGNDVENRPPKPLSRAFRAGAGLLFVLGIPTLLINLNSAYESPSEISTWFSIILIAFSIHVSGHVLFTGIAPGYLIGAHDPIKEEK